VARNIDLQEEPEERPNSHVQRRPAHDRFLKKKPSSNILDDLKEEERAQDEEMNFRVNCLQRQQHSSAVFRQKEREAFDK
jgi:hypothetical protein